MKGNEVRLWGSKYCEEKKTYRSREPQSTIGPITACQICLIDRANIWAEILRDFNEIGFDFVLSGRLH